jgi:hypothetical protein
MKKLLLIWGACWAANAAFADTRTATVSPGVELLRAARGGDMRGVFKVNLFDGIVVLPNIVTMQVTNSWQVAFTVSEPKFGAITVGRIIEGKIERHDANTRKQVPSAPNRSRGWARSCWSVIHRVSSASRRACS